MEDFQKSTEYLVYKSCMSLHNRYFNMSYTRENLDRLDEDTEAIILRYKEADKYRFVRPLVNSVKTNIIRHAEYNDRFNFDKDIWILP
jgi:hypothetical protein